MRSFESRLLLISVGLTMLLGVISRALLGASLGNEVLQMLLSLICALAVTAVYRFIASGKLAQKRWRTRGVVWYFILLGGGALAMWLLPFPAAAIAPIVATILPTLALLPLFRFCEGRKTLGLLLALLGVIAAAVVAVACHYLAAALIIAAIGLLVILLRREHYHEGESRWIGHLLFLLPVLVGGLLLLISELTNPWLHTFFASFLTSAESIETEPFLNYLHQTIFANARPIGASSMREVLIWAPGNVYATVEELLLPPSNAYPLPPIVHYWGILPTILISMFLLLVPVNCLILTRVQRGFQRCVTLTIALLLTFPVLFFLLQNIGLSILMVDFCPFFSTGFFYNTAYLMLIFAAIRHHSPMTAPDGASSLAFAQERRPSSTNVAFSQLVDCPWDHRAVCELRERLAQDESSADELDDFFSPDYRYTVFTAAGRLCDLRLLMETFSFDNPDTQSQILLVEYIDPEGGNDEATVLKNQICAALTPEAPHRLVIIRGHKDSCDDAAPLWTVTVALGSAAVDSAF